jgi:hypothetical protein
LKRIFAKQVTSKVPFVLTFGVGLKLAKVLRLPPLFNTSPNEVKSPWEVFMKLISIMTLLTLGTEYPGRPGINTKMFLKFLNLN